MRIEARLLPIPFSHSDFDERMGRAFMPSSLTSGGAKIDIAYEECLNGKP